MNTTIETDEDDTRTCRNCDKPCSGEYCSLTCEGMDRFPSRRGD